MLSEARFVKAMLREYELCVNARFARALLACLGSGRRVGGGSWKSSAPAASWELGRENGSWILINIKLT